MPKQTDKTVVVKNNNENGSRQNPFVYGVSVFILVLVIVAFVFTGQNMGNSSSSSAPVFGSYAGKNIEFIEGSFFLERAQYLASQQQSTDNNSQDRFFQQAFSDTVFHYAIMNKASENGVTVSDSYLNKMIKNMAQFKDEQGIFDASKVKQLTGAELISLKNNIKEELIHNKIETDFNTGIKIQSSEVQFLIDMYKRQRQLQVASFSTLDYPESEVIAYATVNAELFKKINLSIIKVKDKSKAESFRTQISEKTVTFVDLAKAESLDLSKEQGGKIPTRYVYELKSDYPAEGIAIMLSKLSQNTVSEPFESDGAWTIAMANADPQSPDLTSQQTINDIRNYIAENEKGKLDDYLLKLANDFSAKAKQSSLSAASKASGKTVVETVFFPINVKGFSLQGYPLLPLVMAENYELISDAQEKEKFFEIAFSLAKNSVSDAIILRDKVVVFTVKDEKILTDKDMELFTNYKDTIIQNLSQQDIKKSLIDEKQLVDHFAETYYKNFIARE